MIAGPEREIAFRYCVKLKNSVLDERQQLAQWLEWAGENLEGYDNETLLQTGKEWLMRIKSNNHISEAIKMTKEMKPHRIGVEYPKYSKGIGIIANLAEVLARENDGGFVLSVRDAQRAAECSIKTAWKCLNTLEVIGFIKCSKRGKVGRGEHEATEWTLGTEAETAEER